MTQAVEHPLRTADEGGGATWRDAFVGRVVPDARRRWIWWAVGLPVLKSGFGRTGENAELETELRWARATQLVDETLVEWLEHHEREILALTTETMVRKLTLAMQRWVSGRILREVER